MLRLVRRSGSRRAFRAGELECCDSSSSLPGGRAEWARLRRNRFPVRKREWSRRGV